MGRRVVRYVDSQLKFDSKLVHSVKQHKHLFDPTHKLFDDRQTRINTWESIAKELGKSELYCEKRWLYIINRFYDEILWMIQFETPTLWLLYPQLEFLEDFVEWEDINSLTNELMEFETAIALEGA